MPKFIALKNPELKLILASHGLPSYGRKAEMVKRLIDTLNTDEINADDLVQLLIQPEENEATNNEPEDAEGDNEGENATANNDDKLADNFDRMSISSYNSTHQSHHVHSYNRFSVKEISETIPEYDPTNKQSMSAEHFVDHIESAMKAYGFDTKCLLLATYSRLKGAARLWLDGQRTLFTSWLEFKNELLAEFGQELDEAEINGIMNKTERFSNETTTDYCFRIQALGRRYNLSESAIIKYARSGLRNRELQNIIAITKFHSMRDMRKTLEEYENNTSAKPRINENRQGKRETPRQTYDKNENVKKEIICFNCNESGHISKNCSKPQRKQRCEICKKTTHKTNHCPTQNRPETNVNEVNDGSETKLIKNIRLNGQQARGFVDPGSSRSLIRCGLAYTLAQTTACQISLKGFAGGHFECQEQVKLTLELDNQSSEVIMLVVGDNLITEDVLLGRDVLCCDGQRLIIENGSCQVQTTAETYNIEQNKNTELQQLIQKYKNVFADDISGLGKCSKVQMKIDVTTTTPIQLKPYKIPFARRAVVNDIVSDLLKYEIIRPSTSAYSSPTVLVMKKNGEYRLCVDYRSLNSITRKIPYPMPIMEEQFAQLAGNKYFTTLDLRMGYHQIEMDEDSKKYTAFVTNDGHFEYNRMPFGLVNAPGVFQSLMNQILSNIPNDEILAYLDDVIIPSKTKEQGVERLEKLLKVLTEYGLTLRLDKCRFMMTEIEHLGHVVNCQGIKPGAKKIIAVKEFQAPTNITELRRFLGLTNFFRKFVPGYALIAEPLTKLLRKSNENYTWADEQQKAFTSLIDKLCNAPILALYDVNAAHEVHTDASAVGLAGVLMQSTDDSHWNPVCYYSRRCSEPESRCHSYELEVLAVIETLERFRIYVLGKQFTLVTDCAAIATTKKQTELKPKIARWWMKLLEYDFIIVHRQGLRLAHVDALSRAPVENEAVVTEAGFVYKISEQLDDWLYSMQMQDEKLREIYNILTEKHKSPQCKQLKTDYEIYEQRVFRKTPDGRKFVVPKAIRWRVVEYSHDRMGHPSKNKTLERLRKTYWFPRMTKFVAEYIAACTECCFHKVRGGMTEGELHLGDLQPIPFASVHIDHLGPFMRSKRGNMYVIAISDAFTKYLVVKAVRNTKTAPVINVLNELTSYFGLPSKITTDRGTAYTSKMFEKYCQDNFIRHVKNAVKTPRANGQVERANRMILEYLRPTVTNPRDWDLLLRELQWTINTQKNSTTGFTPNQLVFDFNPRDIMKNTLSAALESQTTNDDCHLNVRRQQALDNLNRVRDEWKKRFDNKHARPRKYCQYDLVLIHNEPAATGESRKLEPKFKGPYQVTRVLENDRYLIESIPGTSHGKRKFCSVFATDKMKPWCVEMPEMADPEEKYDENHEDEVMSDMAELSAH